MQDRHTSQDKGWTRTKRLPHARLGTNNKRMASTLHDCSSRLGDKGYRASQSLACETARSARVTLPSIHSVSRMGLALTRERAALDGERPSGSERLKAVCVCVGLTRKVP